MAAIVNEIDKALQATFPRYTTLDGVANFAWTKYADDSVGTNMSDSPTGKAYMGLAFNKTTATESTNPADYAWQQVTGANGTSTFTATVYVQQAAQPSAPTGGSYNFGTSVLTPPAGFGVTRPGNTTTPTWSAQFTFTSAAVGATVNGGTWSTPVNAGQNGGAANLDPGALKDALVGQLTEDQLYTTLKSRIALIDGSAATPGSVAAQVKAETDARVAAIAQEVTDRTTYVQQWSYSKAASDQSQAAFGSSIQAAYQGYADNAANNALAAAKAYSYSKADSDSAISASATELRSEFQSLNSGAGATVSYVQQYTYSKSQTDSAIASSTQQLSSTVGGLTTTVQTQGQSINGLSAQYSVKIDNNGWVSGYGLASTPINGVPTSSFIVSADRFAVALPGQTAKFPFVIGTVAGQQVIGLRGDMVLDGSLTIRDAAGKVILSAGTSLANQVTGNPNLVARISSWRGPRSGSPQAYLYFDTNSPLGANSAPNGEYIVLPAIGNSGQLAQYNSDALPIAAGSWYTVSFWVVNQGGQNGAMASDVYYYDGNSNTLVDTAGLNVGVPAGQAKFVTYTEQMPGNSNGKPYLRILSGDQNNQFLIWNVKVELGKVPTPWCDSVITKYNASTFMQAAAIGLAFIDTASIGTLSALAAYMDSIHVNGGGALTGGDYTGYAWPGASGKTGFCICPAGLLLGNPTDGKFFQVTADGNIYGANWSVINGVPSFTNPVMSAPTVSNQVISDSYTATISGSAGGSYPNGGASYGTLTANPTGGRAPYSFSWSLSNYASSGNIGRGMSVTLPTQQSVKFGGSASNATLDYLVTCVVTDANGRTLVLNTEVIANHGTPP